MEVGPHEILQKFHERLGSGWLLTPKIRMELVQLLDAYGQAKEIQGRLRQQELDCQFERAELNRQEHAQ